MEQGKLSGTFRWKVVMPILMVMYIFAYLDRTNISFSLDGLQKSLGITSSVSGFISGLFFVGYLVLQLPAGHLASRKSAKRNILILSIIWGVLSSLQGAVTSSTELIIVRFLLGVAEGGMFPSLYVLIANWFPEKERGRASSLFTFYLTVSPLIMSPISGFIVNSVHWGGAPGWRWLFLVEGLPGMIWGLVLYLVIPDHPSKAPATKLSEEEKNFLLSEFAKEAKVEKVVQERHYGKAALNRSFIFLTLSFTALVMGNYGIGIWLPVIIKGISHFNYTVVGFIAAIPWLLATLGMVLTGYLNDKLNNKKGIIAVAEIISGIALLAVTVSGTAHFWLSILFISISAMGICSVQSVYFSMLPDLVSQDMVGGMTGIFAAVANIGGFIGPFIVGVLMSGGNKLGGMIFLSSMLIIAAICILFVKSKNSAVARNRNAETDSLPGTEVHS